MAVAVTRHAMRMGHEAPAFALLQSTENQVDAAVRSPPCVLVKPAHASLGLECLPSRIARLADGLIYGVACDQQAVRLPLLAGALAASLQSGKQCALLTPSDPAMLVRKARLAGFPLEQFLKDGGLSIYQVAAEAAKHLFRCGAEGFLSQLEPQLQPRDAFVVLDQADALFMLSDPKAGAEAAGRYLGWITARNHTMLALFAPAAHAPRDYLTLRGIAENFGGFALARPTDRGAVLEIRHWFGAEGASSRESFELRPQGGGTLGTRADAMARFDQELPPVDSVICAPGAVAGATPAWRSWEQAESLADAIDAARRCEAATLVLPFERPGDYDALCRTVVAVRAMGQESLRVVIRERGLRLRAAQTLTLIRLGASSIIPVDVPDAAAKRMVESLQGTRFARPFDTDIGKIQEETTGLLRHGVTSAASFCSAVERLLAAAEGFDIESCLVRVELDGIEPAKALALARRLGRDLVALSRKDCVWLFMFGCPPSVAPVILKRLFSTPLGELCSGSKGRARLQHDADKILAELRSLRDS
jgi:cellulose biosynthesis protein BcsE